MDAARITCRVMDFSGKPRGAAFFLLLLAVSAAGVYFFTAPAGDLTLRAATHRKIIRYVMLLLACFSAALIPPTLLCGKTFLEKLLASIGSTGRERALSGVLGLGSLACIFFVTVKGALLVGDLRASLTLDGKEKTAYFYPGEMETRLLADRINALLEPGSTVLLADDSFLTSAPGEGWRDYLLSSLVAPRRLYPGPPGLCRDPEKVRRFVEGRHVHAVLWRCATPSSPAGPGRLEVLK